MSSESRGVAARVCRRSGFTLAVLGFASFSVAMASPVQAGITVDLVWIETDGVGVPGSNVIEASPGDQLVLEVRITVDAGGVDAYSISVAFDEDGRDELDLISTVEFEHVATLSCTPFPECFDDFGPELMNLNEGIESEVDSSSGFGGIAEGFEAGTAATGPANLTIAIGQLTFVVTENASNDGVDLEGSLLSEGIDGYLDNSLGFVGPIDLLADPPDPTLPTFVPGFALVPEPARLLLAATAVATLVLLRRLRRLR